MKTTTKPEMLNVSDYALVHYLPDWAIYPLEYGEGEDDMTDEDRVSLAEWKKDYFPIAPVDDQPEARFTTTPAFGLRWQLAGYKPLAARSGGKCSTWNTLHPRIPR